MSASHDEWIAAMIRDRFEGEPHRTLGRCRALVEEMARAFDDLTITKGHVYCPAPWGKRGHWWLVDADGAVVDPTAGQFPRILGYEEYVEGDEVRLGSCMDCGHLLWGPPEQEGKTFCSTTCRDNFAAYLNTGVL